MADLDWEDSFEPPWLLDLPENQKRFYDPATFGAFSGTETREGPGLGVMPCAECSHALARHPLREACEDCPCIWFHAPDPIRPAPRQQTTKPTQATSSQSADDRRTPPRQSGILGAVCRRCSRAMMIGEPLRFDREHGSFAHSSCLR